MPPNDWIIPSMSLDEFVQLCCSGKLPRTVEMALQKSPYLNDLVNYASLLGLLNPSCISRPDACEPRMFVDRDVTVAPATLDDGVVVPSEERAIAICAPLNKPLFVDILRVTAGNVTASSQPFTQPVYKRVNLGTFGEWCLPFEPIDAPGQFANVEHIIVPKQGGFGVYVQNFDPASEAIYHVHAEMWGCC